MEHCDRNFWSWMDRLYGIEYTIPKAKAILLMANRRNSLMGVELRPMKGADIAEACLHERMVFN